MLFLSVVFNLAFLFDFLTLADVAIARYFSFVY